MGKFPAFGGFAMKTTITFWPKGYADADGLSMIGCEGALSPAEAERQLRACGFSWGKVWAVQHYTADGSKFPPPPPREFISEEYRNTMSRNDNS
jgi:hypothetical protein